MKTYIQPDPFGFYIDIANIFCASSVDTLLSKHMFRSEKLGIAKCKLNMSQPNPFVYLQTFQRFLLKQCQNIDVKAYVWSHKFDITKCNLLMSWPNPFGFWSGLKWHAWWQQVYCRGDHSLPHCRTSLLGLTMLREWRDLQKDYHIKVVKVESIRLLEPPFP